MRVTNAVTNFVPNVIKLLMLRVLDVAIHTRIPDQLIARSVKTCYQKDGVYRAMKHSVIVVGARYTLTHSLTHSLTNSLTHSLTQVHTRGKRRFHPFCEISADGRVDPRIFTIDGTQVEDYDATYAQQRADNEADEAPADISSEEWTTAYDDGGNLYFYNNFTGVSQYEDPYTY